MDTPTNEPKMLARKPRAKKPRVVKPTPAPVPDLIIQQHHEGHVHAAWLTMDITIDDLLTTNPAAELVLNDIIEQADNGGDEVLQLLVKKHRKTYMWILNGPEPTERYKDDMQVDAILDAANAEEPDAWGFQLNKRGALINIYCASLTAYDCWRADLHRAFGTGGEDFDNETRVWN